jgi:hypothetical protein
MTILGGTGSQQISIVLDSSYISGPISVSTTAVEAKVGASPLAARESLLIYNPGPRTIYYGPAGVTTSTGFPLAVGQTLQLAVGSTVSVFLVTTSGDSISVRVQELA